jgi:uncharacterized protein (TIGR00251 family)
MDERVVWESDEGTFLKIYVRPRSKKRPFLEICEEEVVVNLKSPARDGKANAELLKRLSKLFRLSTSDLKIVAGHRSKIKTILIEGLSIDSVKVLLHNS